MKQIIPVMTFMLTSTILFSQQKVENPFYSTNVDIVRESVPEKVTDQFKEVEFSVCDLFVCQNEVPVEFTNNAKQNLNNYSKSSLAQPSKFQPIFEIGYSFGLKDYKLDYLLVKAICDYSVSPNFAIGLGSGLSYALDINDALIPFFADFRANLKNRNIPVYVALDIGYSLDVTSDYKTEGFYLMVNPSAGVSFKISDKSDLNIDIGYELQNFKMSDPGNNVSTSSTVSTQGISINVGISL
jgi:hypothetical protein